MAKQKNKPQSARATGAIDIIDHLLPASVAGFVLANGSMLFNSFTNVRSACESTQEEDDRPFEKEMKHLAYSRNSQAEAARLDAAIAASLKQLGYGYARYSAKLLFC